MHVPKDQSEINILSLNLFEPFFILRIGLYVKKFAESTEHEILVHLQNQPNGVMSKCPTRIFSKGIPHNK